MDCMLTQTGNKQFIYEVIELSKNKFQDVFPMPASKRQISTIRITQTIPSSKVLHQS